MIGSIKKYQYVYYVFFLFSISFSVGKTFAKQLKCWVHLSVSTHLVPPLLHCALAELLHRGQKEEWMSPSLPLLPCPPPSTSPPRPPPPLCLLIYLPSVQVWGPFAHTVLCNSSRPTRSSESLEGQTPHPSPSHLQALKKKKRKERKKARKKRMMS